MIRVYYFCQVIFDGISNVCVCVCVGLALLILISCLFFCPHLFFYIRGYHRICIRRSWFLFFTWYEICSSTTISAACTLRAHLMFHFIKVTEAFGIHIPFRIIVLCFDWTNSIRSNFSREKKPEYLNLSHFFAVFFSHISQYLYVVRCWFRIDFSAKSKVNYLN